MRKNLILFALLFLAHAGFTQQLADRDYADLLRKSILFFEAQTCGPNVQPNTDQPYSSFDWRGVCHTGDGDDIGIDLTGGWHDAGDHVKFNYPMAQAVSSLASLYVDYREQINDTGNKDLLLKQLRFISDYMIRCHPEPNKYIIQIADGDLDHSFWQVPEENNYTRTVYVADVNNPNTNLACANAAAFTALSMAFREEDDAYSADLLQHARELYDFGYDYQETYNESPMPGNPYSNPPTGEYKFYKDNNGYQDEIMVGAAWLYRATGEQRYRNEAEAAFNELGNYVGGWAPDWGDNQYEAAYQMAKTTGESRYIDALRRYVVAIANGNEGQYSPGGMWQASAKSFNAGFALPMSLAAASLAYRYADLVGSDDANYTKVRNFAFGQVNYALGDNPRGRSYVVDFGNNSPQITHHRAAHSPEGGSGPINTNPVEDTHTITGALMMGPILDDSYDNTRSNIKYTEPALGNNGILAVCVALMAKETGSSTPPPPPTTTGNVTVRARGTTGSEQIEIRYNDQRVGDRITLSTSYQEYKVQVNNANGNFKVAFVNDNGPRDAEIDWLQVGTTKRQAETRSTNTAVWQNNSCGGSDSQRMNCNGYIGFGTMSDVTSGNVVIRARGNCGSETMILEVGGRNVKTWNSGEIGTSYANYTYSGYSGGTIKVKFTNNQSSPCDRNLYLDYIEVCGTRIQSESASVVQTSNWTNGDKQVLFTDGDNNYGNLGCGSARTSSTSTKLVAEPVAGEWGEVFNLYPNPATDQLTVEGGDDYQVTLYDLTGRKVMQHDHLKGASQLNISHVLPGVYILKMNDSEHELRQRVIVK